jgi:hypothetical protein
MQSTNDLTNSYTLEPNKLTAAKKPCRVHRIFNKNVIALGNDLGILENTWYTPELQPNGDVYLRRFKDIKNSNRRPEDSQQLDDEGTSGY